MHDCCVDARGTWPSVTDSACGCDCGDGGGVGGNPSALSECHCYWVMAFVLSRRSLYNIYKQIKNTTPKYITFNLEVIKTKTQECIVQWINAISAMQLVQCNALLSFCWTF